MLKVKSQLVQILMRGVPTVIKSRGRGVACHIHGDLAKELVHPSAAPMIPSNDISVRINPPLPQACVFPYPILR